MSRQLISRSDDLRRLEEEGYDLAIAGDSYLIVRGVPYVTSERTVARADLVTALSLANDRTVAPDDHTIFFTGATPCDAQGRPLDKLIINANQQPLAEGVLAQHQFSQKPVGTGKYRDFHHKVTAYVAMLQMHAQAIDPTVTARTYPVLVDDDEQPIFKYRDNASSRAGIVVANDKLRLDRLAIVGLGGTGSYILDLVAKTPVRDIHLFDGDVLLQHNAFRAPGAVAREELEAKIAKVDYYAAKYEPMRYGVIPHPYYVTSDNVGELAAMQFVFMAFDSGAAKEALVATLVDRGVDFIDVGMGLLERDGMLTGQLRVSTVSEANRPMALDRQHVPTGAANLDDEYDRNIQVADLNALNATLAVIRYKRLRGFYRDVDNDHLNVYKLITNEILNEARY